MTTLTSFNRTDFVDDHVAADVNNLIAAVFRSEYKNVETLSGTRTLEDVDTPIQRFELGAADRTVKMPTADTVNNHPYFIVNASAAARTITLQNNAGTTTLALIQQGRSVFCIPDANGSYKIIRDFVGFDSASELTISSGAITVTQSINKLQPESGTSDDLATINGTKDGSFGIFYVSDFGTDTITFKHNTGNILCLSGADLAVSNGAIAWYSNGTKVFVIGDGIGSGLTYDMLSVLTAAEISITTATALTLGRMHVISGSTDFTPTLPTAVGQAGKFIAFRVTNTGITTIDGNASETIYGVLTKRYFEDQAVVLMSDNANWVTISQKLGPRSAMVFYPEIISSYSPVTVADAAQNFAAYGRLANANSDTLSIGLVLNKGTYTAKVLGVTASSCGLVDWSLDGTSQITGQDWYSSGTVNNVEKTFTLTVLYTGYHLLSGVVNGKNGSSSSYRVNITYVAIMPTAF